MADSVLTAHSTKSQAQSMSGKVSKVHRDDRDYSAGGAEEGQEAPAEEAPQDE